ncbi:MAG: antibiotic biosynthesis monooxygenase [Ignavibacteriales bacterium]|nr:antibiotic biosynthesis monooxygenase [Ignavibacteriales bacterium]
MRTVKMHVKPEEIREFRSAYENKILPAFTNIKGCRYAALLQSTHNPEECISLTFWTSALEARDFEQSGTFDSLVKILSPHFSESSELQIRLTKDLKLEYASSVTEPQVRKFEVDSPHTSDPQGKVFLRMVSLKFRTEKVEEFKKHYTEKVIPVLRKVDGCRRAFLAAPADNPNELISVTEWESESAAQAYEHGGQFDALLESQRHFFSGLSEWGMAKQKESKSKVATSDDVTVDHYIMLTGRSF